MRFPLLLIAMIALVSLLFGLVFVPPGGAQLSMSQGDAKAAFRSNGQLLQTQAWPWDLFQSHPSSRDPRTAPAPPEVQQPKGRSSAGAYRHVSRSGTYRTWCVRLCDGYYWPISYSTTRHRFRRDAQKCETGCPTKSRLFVHRTDGDVEDMIDLEGQAYRTLENAFRHRSEYVADCTCRGHPWDAEALARHRTYAEAEAAKDRKATTALRRDGAFATVAD